MIPGTDPLLSVFPPPLLRLVLCGGGGLPVAYGPLVPAEGGVTFALSHLDGTPFALHPERWTLNPTVFPNSWRLLLDHWRPRLAVVAAWMLGADVAAAQVRWVGPEWWVSLHIWPARGRVLDTIEWTRSGQLRQASRAGAGVDIPALNALLPLFNGEHDPAVALPLSLFDVSEIRAKVEAING